MTVYRVATDERPLESPASEESGLGRSSCDSPNSSEPEAALAVPPDGGWGWMVVFASFMCNFIIDGIIFSAGTFMTEIKTVFSATDSQVAPVNFLLNGFYLISGPFVSAFANKYGFRVATILGSIVGAVSFAISYYANSVEFLYITYGILGGIGCSMVYMPAVLTVGFYFERWRALATGLSLCGSGVGTLVFAPFVTKLIELYGWQITVLVQAGLILACVLFGAMFRPIKPVRVTLADEPEVDSSQRHEEAVEKLNSMLKLQNKLDSGIFMRPDVRFSHSSSHTWMGVSNNTRYPTAAEVFHGNSSHHLNRRSSVNSGILKNQIVRPMFITTPVVEKDEQDDSNSNIDNTVPLLVPAVKIVPVGHKVRKSTADLVARPLYRDDIFYGGSLSRLPQYTSRTSLGYHMAVTHVPTKQDAREEKSCKLFPEAICRTIVTMFDVTLFKSPTFNLLAISGFITMLGFFAPYAHVIERAKANGFQADKSVWLVSTIGIANIIGRVAVGLVSSMPRVSPLWVNNIALTIGGVATMLSGTCYNEYFQFVYCFIFGLSIACFASLRSILVVEYIGLEQLTNCFGFFLLFQGLGAVLGGLIDGYLLDVTEDYDVSFYMAGAYLIISALICYPVDWVHKWEKERNKNTLPHKV